MVNKDTRPTRIIRLTKKDYNVESEKKNLTTYIKGPQGKFLGRYTGVPSYYSDKTRVLRMKRNIDINHDHVNDLKRGEVVSRLKRRAPSPSSVKIRVHLGKKQRRK